MKNTQEPGPFSVDDFSLLPRDDSGGGEFIILFCNKTYFLHINSEPLTRFIVCMRNRIVVVVVFGIVLCFYCIFFPRVCIDPNLKRYGDDRDEHRCRTSAADGIPTSARSHVNNFIFRKIWI